VDADSVPPEGNLLRYRTKIVHSDPDSTETFEMLVDCSAKTRGQLPSHDLYDTFDGTLGSNELKTVCEIARRERRGT
jgi:hypothetical protein